MRAGLCAVLAVRLSRGIYLELAGQPAILFRPISFMLLFDAMPGRNAALVVQIIGVSAAIAGAFGLMARFAIPAAWLAGVFLNGMATSIGKVVHNDVLLLLCIVPLLFASHAKSGPEWSVKWGWPLRTALVVVAGAYFFAGYQKLVNSGLAWVFSDNMSFILYSSSDSQPDPNPIALFVAARPAFAQLLAAGSLIYELSAPLVLRFRRLAWPFIVGAALLHGGIWLAMRLDYSAQVATVAVVLGLWARTGSAQEQPAAL